MNKKGSYLFAVLAGLLLVAASSAAHDPAVVSLTFDDGQASQYAVSLTLDHYGMKGTFYVNSSNLGGNKHNLTWAQVTDMQARGHEIGGHTLDHPDLTTLDYDQVQHEVCDDRTALLNRNINSISFAYPYGRGWNDNTIEQIVQSCGYASARRVAGVAPPVTCLKRGKVCAETIPPLDPYALRAPVASFTLAGLEAQVTAAEATGGWLVLYFHNVCDGCTNRSDTTSVEVFNAFVSWLATQPVQVKPVGNVVSSP